VDLLRSIRAEWPVLRIRLLRTRLGLWLVLVVAALLWIERAAPASDSLTAILQAGTLGAVLCVGYLAGSGADRAALLLPLLHPTTPGALVLGRWAAASGGAALAVLAVAAHAAWTTGAIAASLSAALAGLAAAAAVASCTLALVLTGGNVLAALFFVWLALIGGAPPETLIRVPHPGSIRVALAVVLEVAPAPWRYRAIAAGDPAALLHAAAWVALGLATARSLVGRLSVSPR
jgi:hypothetical protein